MTNRREERREALDKLIKLMNEAKEVVPEITSLELSTEAEMRAYGKAQFEAKLEKACEESGEPRACPKCKKKWRVRAKEVERKFKSTFGEHVLRRNQHYCEDCKSSFYPADDFLGLPHDADVTLELARRITDMGMNDTLDFGTERWNFHYSHIPISSNQIRGVLERLGDMLKACNEIILHTSLMQPENVDRERLYVMTDGGMVPMRNGLWRECKSGVIFREKNHVRSTEETRGIVFAPRYVSTLEEQEKFKQSLEAALHVENVFSAKEVVWVGDGAKGNWSLASALAPGCTQILDFLHAVEHASNTAKVLFGEEDACVPLFRERVSQLLICGEFKAVMRELRACLKLQPNDAGFESLKKLIQYYENNGERMHYDEYLERGLMIGSGIVESSHRHVIQVRMKRAGQHWGMRGGDAMARMRAAYKTAGPRAFFQAILAAHAKSQRLKLHPNFSKPLKKRYASNR